MWEQLEDLPPLRVGKFQVSSSLLIIKTSNFAQILNII
jgi:hypothetical protein